MTTKNLTDAFTKKEEHEATNKNNIFDYSGDYRCYIATACYKSNNCIQVLTFRHFRDEYLSKLIAGRIFIKIYYALSPPIARWLKDKHVINSIIRKILLDPIYTQLKKN